MHAIGLLRNSCMQVASLFKFVVPRSDIVGQDHRLQLSRNVRDSPGFVAIVPGTGRPLYGSIVGPG